MKAMTATPVTAQPISITGFLCGISSARLQALFAQEPQRSADWVHALAAEGSALAQVCYGRMLLAGTGRPKDEPAALSWFRRAAAQGDLDGINMLGRCLDEGWGTAIDPAAAAGHYRHAADAGHAWAQYNLGHLYLDGRGVPRDLAQALACYRSAAAQGHARAMNLVGRCHEQGWGTPVDHAAAAECYRQSAHGGYFRGQFNWASVLLGLGRSDEAALWFERAAGTGSAAVRQAVIEAGQRRGAPEALQRLAMGLQPAEHA